jgi:hypothetical protein
MENSYINILSQLFQLLFDQKQIPAFDQKNYMLESGAELLINPDCNNEAEAKKFVENFFCTNVFRMQMVLQGKVLKFPCKLRYRGKFKNDISESIDVENVEVDSGLSEQIYRVFFIKKN